MGVPELEAEIVRLKRIQKLQVFEESIKKLAAS